MSKSLNLKNKFLIADVNLILNVQLSKEKLYFRYKNEKCDSAIIYFDTPQEALEAYQLIIDKLQEIEKDECSVTVDVI